MKTEYYVCRRLRLLGHLQQNGFEPVETIPDAKNPRYRCWLFVSTPALLQAVEDYYNNIPTK